MKYTIKPVSSLEKVFQDDRIYGFKQIKNISAFMNEAISFQIIYTLVDEKVNFENKGAFISFEGEDNILESLTIRNVDFIPSTMPNYNFDIYSYRKDNFILRDQVTQYPDLLSESNSIIGFTQNVLKSLWITR